VKYEAKYPSDPGHPDYDQYMTLKNMVDKMHGDNGIDGGDISHRATAAMLRSYKTEAYRENGSLDPRSGIDGVVLSRNNDRFDDLGGRYAIMYQGDPNSPTVRTLAVPTQELTQAAEKNFEEINRINQQREQQYAQTQEREQERQRQAREQDPVNMGARTLF
jgi:hypothetical protein